MAVWEFAAGMITGKANRFGTSVGNADAVFYVHPLIRITRQRLRRRQVYLVDASGSLIDTLPFVLRELQQSISKLSDQQKFTVIFFQGKDVGLKVPPSRRATADVKQSVSTGSIRRRATSRR